MFGVAPKVPTYVPPGVDTTHGSIFKFLPEHGREYFPLSVLAADEHAA